MQLLFAVCIWRALFQKRVKHQSKYLCLQMPMPSSEIMLWKRTFHKYALYTYVKSSLLNHNHWTCHWHCKFTQLAFKQIATMFVFETAHLVSIRTHCYAVCIWNGTLSLHWHPVLYCLYLKRKTRFPFAPIAVLSVFEMTRSVCIGTQSYTVCIWNDALGLH